MLPANGDLVLLTAPRLESLLRTARIGKNADSRLKTSKNVAADTQFVVLFREHVCVFLSSFFFCVSQRHSIASVEYLMLRNAT